MAKKERKVDKSNFRNYYNRAKEFYKAMQEESSDGRYNASALIAIHAAIAITDSLTVYERGIRSVDEQHMMVMKIVKDICSRRQINDQGINHFKKVLSKKNFIAYEEHYQLEDTDQLKNIRLHVERYFTWLFKNFKQWSKEINGRI